MSTNSLFSLSNEPSRQMNRYHVKITLDTDPVKYIILLVPFAPESTLADLTAEVIRRLEKQDVGSVSASTAFKIHMSDSEGPLLDAGDRLCDILHGEELYFEEHEQPKATVISDHSTFRFQIYTPQFARSGSESEKLIVEINEKDTLKQLHDKICGVLNIPTAFSGFKIDMHTQENPVHSSAFPKAIRDTDLAALAVDGTIPLFVVPRLSAREEKSQPVGQGMSDVFRVQDHWQPSVKQSDRGMAMMLSSLRVFAQLAKQHKLGDRYRAAVLSVFAGLSKFTPAIRSLYLLLEGSKPTASECIALSYSLLEILGDIVPVELILNDRGRLFEGARLLFGLLSEKARELAQSDADLIVALADFHPVQAHDAVFATANETDRVGSDPTLRVCTLSGVRDRNVIVFRGQNDTLSSATVGLDQTNDVAYLAELCGQSGLAVWRPATLASAAAPCLTFDEDGLVCVYTGREPCALPGRDMGVFRPLHGDCTPDMAQVESKLAPFLRQYALDGTDVFDVSGSPRSRQLEAPDEILMFCVDISQSMEERTAFLDDSSVAQDDDLVRLVEVEAFEKATLATTEASLCTYEGYQDVLEAVKEASQWRQKTVARKMLQLISIMVLECLEIKIKSHERLDGRSHTRQREVRAEIERLQMLAAGLRTFNSELVDFIVFRSASIETSEGQYWQIGDGIPSESPGLKPFPLEDDITDIPVHLRCPVSYTALEDPVVAADGQTYSLASISKWFSIRKSSPLTGLPMPHTDLRPHTDLAQEVSRWTQSDDLIAASSTELSTGSETSRPKRRRTGAIDMIDITFTSSSATFKRSLPKTLTTKDLYKVAFRGMRARHTKFLLLNGRVRVRPQTVTTIATIGTASLEILVFPEGQIACTDPDACLIKVFDEIHEMSFGFWSSRWSADSLRLVVIRYWRFMLGQDPGMEVVPPAVWSNLVQGGDNYQVGQENTSETQLNNILSTSTVPGILGYEGLHDLNSTGARVTVLKLYICEKKPRKTTLSRLEVLKQMFEALVNRMLAYSFMPHIGLISISTQAQEVQAISHDINNFRNSVENLKHSGDTALWDGLLLAKNRIGEYATKFPNAKKRIICLSDGKDTTSSIRPAEVYSQLRKEKIMVDSIYIGEGENPELKAISYLLGSYAFKPKDMTTALGLCEMEPMLSLLERPEVEMKAWNSLGLQTHFESAKRTASFTKCTKDVVPPRRQHDRLGDGFLELTSAVAARRSTSSAVMGAATTRSNTRTTRLLSEMQAVAHNPSPQYDVYVSEVDMSFWEICMKGPSETPYEAGTFLLYLDMPTNYPAFPPKARFITKVLHPNVNPHGRICHSIFDRDWTSDTSLTSVLNTIYGLLFQADYSDPVHTIVTLGYHHDQVELADEVRAHVAKYASKSAEEWRRELLEA